MKLFFDSSVLVAAFTFRGVCARLLAHATASHSVFVSEYVVEEVARTLRNKFQGSTSEVAEQMQWLRVHSTVLGTFPLLDVDLRDSTDVPVLSAAVAANAEILVSGDKDLLELLNPPIRILSPRALHDLIVPRP